MSGSKSRIYRSFSIFFLDDVELVADHTTYKHHAKKRFEPKSAYVASGGLYLQLQSPIHLLVRPSHPAHSYLPILPIILTVWTTGLSATTSLVATCQQFNTRSICSTCTSFYSLFLPALLHSYLLHVVYYLGTWQTTTFQAG